MNMISPLDDSQTTEAETMETGDQPADTSVIEGDRYVLVSPWFGNCTYIVIDEIYTCLSWNPMWFLF